MLSERGQHIYPNQVIILVWKIMTYRDPNYPALEMWSMSADKYLKEAIKNVENDLENDGKMI